MKKCFHAILALTLTALLILMAGCATNTDTKTDAGTNQEQPKGNFTDEMKIPYGTDLSPDDGADSVERMGDHEGSLYFSNLDFYNMSSTDTLTILHNFKTQQQTSEWSCGVSTALMTLNWYGKQDNHDELSLSDFRKASEHDAENLPGGSAPSATSLQQMIDIFNTVGGFDIYSTFDCAQTVGDVFTLSYIRETLEAGNPVLVGWNDWGGHWQAVIGYDTMGTETESDDVIIVADPYDTTDHNQDGYGVYGAERFIYNFTFYNFFPEQELNDMTFLVVTPQ